MPNNSIKCPKCGNNNVVVQMVSETKSERQNHSFWWWLLIGWWLELALWIFLTVPRLLIALFMPKRQKITTSHKSVAVCQNCGDTFDPQKIYLEKIKAEEIEKKALYKASKQSNSKPFYEKTIFIIFTLIVFPPVGIPLFFKFMDKPSKTVKIIISVLFGLFWINTLVTQ